MKMHFGLGIASIVLILAACSSEQADTGSEADDFAARINGDQQVAQGSVEPTVAPPRDNAAPGAFAPGTATDPDSATCGANMMGPFLGRPADEAARAEIQIITTGVASAIRFVAPGGDYIRPDPTNPRLNLMLDDQGIIRDARCG